MTEEYGDASLEEEEEAEKVLDGVTTTDGGCSVVGALGWQ